MFLSSDAAGRWSWPRVALGLTVVAVFGAGPGCFSTDNGPEPPLQQMYYPTAIIPSPTGHALYVVNSDFDLQYKAGTVQGLDLDRLRGFVPRLDKVGSPSGKLAPDGTPIALTTADQCAAAGVAVQTTPYALLIPGACTPVDLNGPPVGTTTNPLDPGGTLVRSVVSIGAFAADAALSLRPSKDCCPKDADGFCMPGTENSACGARLLIPVRGDPSLTWIDIDDDRDDVDGAIGRQRFTLACDQGSAAGHCADSHKAGVDPSENTRHFTMPSEPFSIAVSADPDDQTAVIVSHQTTGTVSLLRNTWDVPPTLSFVLPGLATGVTGTLSFPKPQLVTDLARGKRFHGRAPYPYQPGFLLSFRTSAEVDVVRYYDDAAASPSRPFLALTSRIGISTNAVGFDSRAIAIDTRARRAAEAACDALTGDDAIGCLAAAAGTPVSAFAANRIPPTLLLGQTTTNASTYGTDDSVYFYDSVPLSQGPSRLYVAAVWDPVAGVSRTRVFILCFDARTLYVYDPDAHAMEKVVQTGRGPAALAFDPLLGKAAGAADPGTPAKKRGDGLAMGESTSPSGNYAYLAHFTDSYIGVLDLDMSHSTYLTIVGTIAVPAAPRESK